MIKVIIEKAVEQENLARTICEVLYPNDNHMAGKELTSETAVFLRVCQLYSVQLQNIWRNMTISVRFHEKVCIPVE